MIVEREEREREYCAPAPITTKIGFDNRYKYDSGVVATPAPAVTIIFGFGDHRMLD